MSIQNNKQITELFSINDIVKSIKDEKWKINVAQRAFEWDLKKISNLVDSTLRRIPIGSIMILKDSEMEHYDFQQESRFRELKGENGGSKTDQILDGQQRSYSLNMTYGGEGFHTSDGRTFYLWINLKLFNSNYREFDPDRGHKYYFHWSSLKDINELSEYDKLADKLSVRWPNSGWIKFDYLLKSISKPSFAKDIMSDFDIDETQSKCCTEIIQEATRALYDKCIPVYYIDGKTTDTTEIFHIFVRINTAGKSLDSVDIFFSGVKKYWRDAEVHIANLVKEDSLFDRKEAISLLGRIASMSFNQKEHGRQPTDPVRIKISDLKPSQDESSTPPLVTLMQKLSEHNSVLVETIVSVSKAIRQEFYVGADLLNKYNVMTAVAWAYQYRLSSGKTIDWSDKKLTKPLFSFLFWEYLFSAHAGTQDSFFHYTFKVAWKAGASQEPFPYYDETIQNYFLYHIPVSRAPNRHKPDSFFIKDRSSPEYTNIRMILDLLKWNSHYFVLGIYQKVKSNIPLDIDHLLAADLVRYKIGTGYKYTDEIKKHRLYWADRIGNFCLISASANRSFQAVPPSAKLMEHDHGRTYLNNDFIKTDHGLSEDEIRMLLKIEEFYEKNPDDREKASEMFQEFVCFRSEKIWNYLLNKYDYPDSLKQREKTNR